MDFVLLRHRLPHAIVFSEIRTFSFSSRLLLMIQGFIYVMDEMASIDALRVNKFWAPPGLAGAPAGFG
jgi:hypothetical protein